MRAKKLTTGEGGEVLMVLKGAKHITSSFPTNPQIEALTAISPHNWAAVDGKLSISANRLNSENRSCTLDKQHSESYQKEGQSICGNSSFLSRFIEFRINNNLSIKMTSGNENGSEEPSGVDKSEMQILLKSPVSEDQPVIESSTDGADSIASDILLLDQSDNRSTDVTDMLSCSVTDKEGNASEIQNEEFSPKQCEGNAGGSRVIGDISRNILPKIPTIRRVDELRIRIEGNLENTDSAKLCKNGNSVVNSHKGEKYAIKSTAEVKEGSNKAEIKRSSSNTRENPPRKVSFKVRSGFNNGRLSSSYISSVASRRSSALSKGSLMDSRVPSKVAVLASKFNAIIHENKEEKSVEIIQNDSKNKLLMIPQFSAGPINTTIKKQPQMEKAFVSRRNSSNSKRESCLSNTGSNAKNASLGVTLRKSSSTKQPLLDSDNNHNSCNSGVMKDCKRRSNMPYRLSSAVGAKSGSVKAAIQIFERNATTVQSAKDSAIALVGNRRNLGDSRTCESNQSPGSAEAKKAPKYPRVIFKRDATLVRVTLDCEDVCNKDKAAEQVEGNSNTQANHCRKSASILPGRCGYEEQVCVKKDEDIESYIAQCKRDNDVAVIVVESGSGLDEKGKKQAKIKPAVPVKNVTKKQICKGVPFPKRNANDSNYVKMTCQPETIYTTAGSESVAENASAQYDKLAFLHKAPAGLESSINKIPSTRERKTSKESDRESMAPNRSFLWGVSPPNNKVRTQDDQSASIPVPVTEDYELTNSEDPTPVTNDDAYDDVYPPSTVYSDGVSSIHPYSVVHPEDDVYDDVCPPVTEDKQSPRIPTILGTR
jgi:hypothetical protein